MHGIITSNHPLFWKIFSNFVHFFPNFQMFHPFFAGFKIFFGLFWPFSEKLHAYPYFLEQHIVGPNIEPYLTAFVISMLSMFPIAARCNCNWNCNNFCSFINFRKHFCINFVIYSFHLYQTINQSSSKHFYMPKCLSCHKANVVITGRLHCIYSEKKI